MGVASPILEPHPPNLVGTHFFFICKTTVTFVWLSQTVYNLEKIFIFLPDIGGGGGTIDGCTGAGGAI